MDCSSRLLARAPAAAGTEYSHCSCLSTHRVQFGRMRSQRALAIVQDWQALLRGTEPRFAIWVPWLRFIVEDDIHAASCGSGLREGKMMSYKERQIEACHCQAEFQKSFVETSRSSCYLIDYLTMVAK